MIDKQKNTFSRASEFIKDWHNKTVLDYGGQIGALLRTSNNKILEKNYTCLDIMPDAILKGLSLYPDANWIHVDMFNAAYNPKSKKEKLILTKKFDIIFSHSVFTHTSIEEWVEKHNYLKQFVNKKGILCHTYIDFDWNKEYIEKMQKKRISQYGSVSKIVCDDYIYLVNNNVLTKKFPNQSVNQVISIYKTDFLKNVFPDCNFIQGTQQSGMILKC